MKREASWLTETVPECSTGHGAATVTSQDTTRRRLDNITRRRLTTPSGLVPSLHVTHVFKLMQESKRGRAGGVGGKLLYLFGPPGASKALLPLLHLSTLSARTAAGMGWTKTRFPSALPAGGLPFPPPPPPLVFAEGVLFAATELPPYVNIGSVPEGGAACGPEAEKAGMVPPLPRVSRLRGIGTWRTGVVAAEVETESEPSVGGLPELLDLDRSDNRSSVVRWSRPGVGVFNRRAPSSAWAIGSISLLSPAGALSLSLSKYLRRGTSAWRCSHQCR